jgi:hypothetical protein
VDRFGLALEDHVGAGDGAQGAAQVVLVALVAIVPSLLHRVVLGRGIQPLGEDVE